MIDARRRGPGNGIYLRACSQACDGGHGEACEWRGFMLRYGLGVDRDEVGSRDAYRRGCDLGHAECCNTVGVDGLRDDLVAAIRMLRRACDLGSANACSNLGLVLQLAPPLQADIEEGNRICERQHQRGFKEACAERLRKLIERDLRGR
jgi:hypothetical protein